MSADKDIDGWLGERGITAAESRARARAALEEVGLTSARKVRISEPKLPRAEQVLAERFYRVCAAAACQQLARASGREPLPVDPRSHCEHCGGSNNQRAETAFLGACERHGVRRVVVVSRAAAASRPEVPPAASRPVASAAAVFRAAASPRRTRPRAQARCSTNSAASIG